MFWLRNKKIIFLLRTLNIETHFDAFTNRAHPDQAATRAAIGSTLFAYGNMIYLILLLWINMKDLFIIFHSGRSLT